MNQKQAKKNVRLFYLYQAFLDPLFWGAIIITFIQRVAGMSPADIFFMESVCVFLMILLEIPTGALADLIGRKKTIIAGQIALALGIGLLAIAYDPLGVWISNLFCFLGFSLIHGADTSFLQETLIFLDRGQEYKKIKGRAASLSLFLTAIAGFFAGHLAEINLRIPIFLALISFCISIIASALFTEPPLANQEKFCWKNHWDLMKLSVLFVANHKKIKWLIGFTVLIGTASKIWFFTYNPYFELVNLPLPTFGYIFCAIGLCSALSSYSSHWLANRLGNLASIIIILGVIGVPILIMGLWVYPIIAFLVVLQSFVRGYFDPFFEHIIHDYLDSQNRATVFSIKSAARGISDAIFLNLFSWILRGLGLPVSLQILGITVLGIGLFLILRYQSTFNQQKS